jgi:hypothetical protein
MAKMNPLRERQSWLIHSNVLLLRQAGALLLSMRDTEYVKVGGQFRHILEFYECLLDGLASSHIDYDARRRDLILQSSRSAAGDRIDAILARLEAQPALLCDCVVWVRLEDAEGARVVEPFLASSLGRELQALRSHTIHHFALIAMMLRALGVTVDPDFGVAPSTLRYRASQSPAEAA